MKLIAELKNEKHEVEIRRDGDLLFARVDDREYKLEADEVEPNLFLIKFDNQIRQVYVAPSGVVNIGNHQFEIKLSDPKRLRGSGDDDAAAAGTSEVKTAMPGKIVRILVEPGEEVEHGQGVIVVEAMKMQNEMKAPKTGVVSSIRFAEGATVNAGDVLIVID
jgi:biotin carboxyl carrier protein